MHTKLSPFSFVILAGKPAGSACWKTSSCPALAASYMRDAKAIASGGSSGAEASMLSLSAIVDLIFCCSVMDVYLTIYIEQDFGLYDELTDE